MIRNDERQSMTTDGSGSSNCKHTAHLTDLSLIL